MSFQPDNLDGGDAKTYLKMILQVSSYFFLIDQGHQSTGYPAKTTQRALAKLR